MVCSSASTVAAARIAKMKGLCFALCLFLGCGVSRYSAETKVLYEVTPDGAIKASYSSEKEHEGVIVEVIKKDDQVTAVKIHVDKSGTSEAALATMAQAQRMFAEVLQKLIPLLERAALAGS